MVKLYANSGDPDQTPRSAASDLGLHCLPIALLGVSRLQWDKHNHYMFSFKNVGSTIFALTSDTSIKHDNNKN